MKRSIPILAVLFATVALGTGCVTAKKYEALEADLAKAQGELTESRGQVTDLQTAIHEAEAEIEALGGQITKLKESLAVAESRASDAETQLANVIKDRSSLAASVEDMTKALAELQRLQADAEARLAEYRNVITTFKDLIDSKKLKAKIVDGRLVLELQTDVLFDSGSAKLSEEGIATIREVGQLLGTIPDRRFQVEGHTDDVPIKTKTYPSNWELAAARSINVVKEMVDAGMPGKRISGAAFADTRPTASNTTEEGRAQNRRIEIVIVPDLSKLPGAAEIEKLFNTPPHS